MPDYFDEQERLMDFVRELSENPTALDSFSELSPFEQRDLFRRTGEVESCGELRDIVRGLSDR